jgi:hypothetical protein
MAIKPSEKRLNSWGCSLVSLSALFALFLAESQVKTLFPIKSCRKSLVLALFARYLPKIQTKKLSAKFVRLSAKF